MIKNIKYATDQKIILLAADEFKKSAATTIRQKFPAYRTFDNQKMRIQPKSVTRVRQRIPDDLSPIEYDPQMFE
jgi:hypothetical protein